MKIYPLKFKPIFKERIWGGQKLADVFGKQIPKDVKIGESWELADLEDDKSVIVNGHLSGQTLASAINGYAEAVTADANFAGPFPLLIKLLDAEDVLSVQVHPDEDACRRMKKGSPKTECWYIIAAEPQAVIYKGLKRGVTKERMADAIKTGTVADLLIKVSVKAGECHFLPAGTIHAIGAGLLIAEIQTPSDTTYRVFDWNRFDERGDPRQLHIEESLESIHYDSSGDNLTVETVGRLVDCPYFKVDKCHQAPRGELFIKPQELKVFIFTKGLGKIINRGTEPLRFAAGDTILLPAAFEGAMRCDTDTEYLKVTL